MASSTKSAVLIVSTFLFSFVLAQHPLRVCELNLNKLIGSTNSYVYTCDCTQPRSETIGRAEAKLPGNRPDNAAQASTTIRCIVKNEKRLLALCLRDPNLYNRKATTILKRCLKARPTPADLDLKGKFRFNQKTCKPLLATLLSPSIAGVWICLCLQETFGVVAGRAAFITKNSPLGDVNEVNFLKNCVNNRRKEINRVCRKTPGDFELLALQLFQVCCKRGRVKFRKRKFRCAAIVPNDVSDLKIPLLNALA